MSTTATDMTTAQPVRMLDGGRLVLRSFQLLLGVSLITVAFGLWLMPGSSIDSDLLLFKLLLSIVAGFVGLGLLQSGAPRVAPHVEIDTIRREVRLMRAAPRGPEQIIHRCAFDDLAKAEVDGPHVRLWDASGNFMAEVTLTDAEAFGSLTACLHTSGKIA